MNRRTISTWKRCRLWNRRFSASRAARSSFRMTAGSSTASRRISSRSKEIPRSCGSKATGRNMKRITAAATARTRTIRSPSATRRLREPDRDQIQRKPPGECRAAFLRPDFLEGLRKVEVEPAELIRLEAPVAESLFECVVYAERKELPFVADAAAEARVRPPFVSSAFRVGDACPVIELDELPVLKLAHGNVEPEFFVYAQVTRRETCIDHGIPVFDRGVARIDAPEAVAAAGARTALAEYPRIVFDGRVKELPVTSAERSEERSPERKVTVEREFPV